MVMKTRYIFCLILAVLGTGYILFQKTNGEHWGPATNDFQISISLENGRSNVQLGQPIILLAYLRNISKDKTIYLYENNQTAMDGTYTFSIINPSGNDISPDTKGFLAGSGAFYPIGPGQTHTQELDLSSVCKFETVGAYKVVVTKRISDASGLQPSPSPFNLISKPLYIKVVQ
jgi:hypothetical protein